MPLVYKDKTIVPIYIHANILIYQQTQILEYFTGLQLLFFNSLSFTHRYKLEKL